MLDSRPVRMNSNIYNLSKL